MNKRTIAEITLAALLLAGCSSTASGTEKKKSTKKEETSSETEDSSSKVTTGVLEDTDASASPEPEETEDSDDAVEGDITADVITETQAASNQKYAPLLTIGTRVTGTMNDNGAAWYAFKTSSDVKAEYDVTVVNMDPEGSRVWFDVYDEMGNAMSDNTYAEWWGKAVTLEYSQLDPETVYYVKITCDDHQNPYSLTVRSTQDKSQSAYLTTGAENLEDFSADENPGEDVGTNQVEATFLSLNSDVDNNFGTYKQHWYAFRTISDTKAVYHVTVINTDEKGERVWFDLYDDYGNTLTDSKYAENDGQAQTLTFDKLNPDTVYYINVSEDDLYAGHTYNLKLSCDAAKKEEKKTTFQVPFSLDETQVKFRPDSDEFADENAAKEAIKPVADKILKYPDNKILLAGTTATFGNQSAAEKLSGKRAEAVKKLLTDEYDVPAKQLETAGLGFEKDPFERAADMDVSGNFIESEAKKNRRVVVLDADSDTAKKILGN